MLVRFQPSGIRKDRKDEKMNWKNDKHEALGNEIISELFPQLLNVKIAWLSSDKDKQTNGKTIFAECSKVTEKYDWCCPYDFTITVYEPNVSRFSDEQMRILLEHELMHIGVDEKRMYIVPHDAEEFTEIIRKYRIDWSVTE